MAKSFSELPNGALWSSTRVIYPADHYRHASSTLLQVRLVRRGSSYAQIDLGLGPQRVYTRPGDLLVSLPDRGTAFRIDEARELTLLQVERRYALRLLRQTGASGFADLEPLLRKPAREPLVAEIIRRLEHAEPVGRHHEWSVGLVMHGLFREARRLAARKDPRDVSSLRFEELMRSVRAQPDEPWSVDRLAEEAGVPRRAFAAMFKAAQGLPFHQYVMRLRAERAIDMLRTADLSLAEVATAAGFSHQAHMTRVLGRLKGKTPLQIRKSST